MSDTQEKELYDLCKIFIDEQNINCAESIYQTDRVIENAYVFIERICDIVGYKPSPYDDD